MSKSEATQPSIVTSDSAESTPPEPSSVQNVETTTSWDRYIHPNGQLYFLHRSKGIITFDNVSDSVIEREVYDYFDSVKSRIQREKLKYLSRWYLAINIHKQEHQSGSVQRSHAFLDEHRRKLVTVSDNGLLQYGLESEYWRQLSKAPMHFRLPPEIEDEMLAAVSHCYLIRINGESRSMVAFSHDQCQYLIHLYETLRRFDSAVTTGVRTWFVCRIMITIWEAREAYRYGEPDAITTIEPYLEAPHNLKQRIVSICIYALCFGMHNRYREQLLLCHTKRGFHISAFRKFLQGMLQEWADSNLLGTVFVSANMAFLAVGQIQGTERTMVLISTLFSMASVLSGVHHSWKHRPKTPETHESEQYIENDMSSWFSRTTLSSIFLSFPLVFLLWSVISFGVALLHFGFQNSKGVSRGILALTVALVLFSAICVRLFFYGIWDADPQDGTPRLRERVLNVISTIFMLGDKKVVGNGSADWRRKYFRWALNIFQVSPHIGNEHV